MPRTTIAAQVPLGSIGDYSVADAADITFTAADTVNQNQTTLTGKEMILARNVDASPHNITVNSVPDPFNRTNNITNYALGANEHAIFGPFDRTGWRQTDGQLYFEGDNVNIEFAVIRIP